MAENLDPESIRQFNESIRELNNVLPTLITGLGQMTGVAAGTTKVKDALNKHANAVKGMTELDQSYIDAQKKKDAADANRATADAAAIGALKNFTSAMMNTSTEFSKFNSTLSSAGDAALALGKNFGAVGLIIGGLIKGATKVAELATVQADNALKATDQFNKMGAAGQHTAKEIGEMGIRIGLSNEQWSMMPKVLKRTGDSIVSLGATTADGQKKFMGMLAVTNEQREAFQRLGVNQEDLMGYQADYVALQKASGAQLVGSLRTEEGRRKASLEYTSNLLQLAAITGKDIDTVAAQQKQAQAAYEIQLDNARITREIKKAEQEGNTDRVKQLEAEKEARNSMLNVVADIGDADITAGLQKFLATGAITEQSAAFAQMGVDMQGFRKRMQDGEDVSAEFAQALKDGIARKQEEVGTAAAYNKEVGKVFGLTEKTMEWAAGRAEVDEKKARAEAARSIGKPEDEKTGATAAEDPAQKARNAATTATIEFNRALEKGLIAVNPLLSGFNSLTAAVTGLTAAAIAAAAALATIGAKGALGKVLGTSTMPESGGGKGVGKGGGFKGAMKGVGMGGAAALGGMALGAGADYAKKEGNAKTGAGLDIASQAASYAGTGAMIGSVIPGVGTAAGAIAGGLLGAGMGLYQNMGVLTSGGTDGGGVDASTKATGASAASTRGMAPPKVKVSSAGMSEEQIKAMIMAHEGVRNRPYKDSLGLWTVGVGHLIGDGKSLPPEMNREFSDEEIMAMFEKDYAHHRSAAMNIPGFDKLDGRGQGALTDLTFNMGPSWISKWPKLKKQLEAGDTKSAAQNLEQSKWYGQVGTRAPTIVSLLRDSSQVSASLEGIAQGPESGYSATLHGNELIKRLTKDSILDKLANTPAGDMFSGEVSAKVDNSELVGLMKEFVEKMDDLLVAQTDSNSIQSELLLYSKV